MARVSDIACAIEPYDKVWGVGASGFVKDPSPFERINLILDDTERTTNGEVFADRCVIMTRVMKDMPGYPQIIKNAEAMAAFFREAPVQIYDHELIVGSMLCPKKGAPVFPEFGLNWLIDEMENGLLDYSEKRTHDYFHFTDECYKQLKECEDYWVGNCAEDRLTPNLTKDEIEEAYEKNTGVLIAEYFKNSDYEAVPAVLCKNHGPFTWGKDAHEAVHNAVVLEEVAKMASRCELINPNVKPAPQELQDKHYYRKHGANAYYGQENIE